MSSTDLVTLSRVAKKLKWNPAQLTADREEMADLISAVTGVVEDIVGPVVIRSFDEWYDGGFWRITLNNSPVSAVTLVSESWGGNTVYTLTDQPMDGQTASDAYGYTVDKLAGTIVRRSVGQRVNFAAGRENIRVTYAAGYCTDTASVPANIRQAALEIIRWNWQPEQTGNWAGAGGSLDDPADTANSMHLGYFVPPRAWSLLNAKRTAGVA